MQSRYGKFIKLIHTLYSAAVNDWKKLPEGESYTIRKAKTSYRFEMYVSKGKPVYARLIHYNTCILSYNIQEHRISVVNGHSASDRDAINTLLTCLHHPEPEYVRIEDGQLVIKREEPAKNSKYYVSMTDKLMSGWGAAEGRINKLVFECDTFEEAQIVKENAIWRYDVADVRLHKQRPHFDSSVYYVQIKTKNEYPKFYEAGAFE